MIQRDPGIDARRKLAQLMTARQKTGPVRTGMEGAGRLAQAMANAYGGYKAEKDQNEYLEAGNEDLARIMSDYGQDVRPLSQHPSTGGIASQIQMMQAQQDQAGDAAASARQHGLEDFATKEGIKAQYAKPQKGTTVMQNALALGLQPGSKEYQEYIRESTKKGPLVSVGGDTYSPLQKELAKSNAKSYDTWRTEAIGAGKMEPYLAQMEAIAEQFETGKAEQAMATMGQWLGTDSSTALQAFKAAQVPVMLQMAEAISGTMTEAEWTMLRSALPDFGTNPEANKIVLRLMRRGIEDTKRNFAEAQQYITDNDGSLRGYMPHYASRKPTGSANKQPDSDKWEVMEDANGNKAYVNKETGQVKEL